MRVHSSLFLAWMVAAVSDGAAQQSHELQRLGWLAGCWELRRGDRVTLEMWMPPAGDLMLGSSRTTTGGVVREFEQLRLTWQNGRVVYTARPSGQDEASFSAAAVSDSGFAVANPNHDFPQRIIYRRRGPDSLIARIEGPGPNGVRGFDFPMRRISCASPDPRGGASAAVRAELFSARDSIWRAWFTNDRTTLEALLPEHTIAINNGDTTWQDRPAIIRSAQDFQQQGGKLVALTFPRTEFQVYGDVAILYSLFEMHLEVGGTRSVQRGRATEVFIKRGGRWLNASWHLDSGS